MISNFISEIASNFTRGAEEMLTALKYDESGRKGLARHHWMQAASIFQDTSLKPDADYLFQPLIQKCIASSLFSVNPLTKSLSREFINSKGQARSIDIWRCPVELGHTPLANCIYFIGRYEPVDHLAIEMAVAARNRRISLMIVRLSVTHPPDDQSDDDIGSAISECIDDFSDSLCSPAIPTACVDGHRFSSSVTTAAMLNPRINAVVGDGWLWTIAERASRHTSSIEDIVEMLLPIISAATHSRPLLIAPATGGWLKQDFVGRAVLQMQAAGVPVEVLLTTSDIAKQIVNWIAHRVAPMLIQNYRQVQRDTVEQPAQGAF